VRHEVARLRELSPASGASVALRVPEEVGSGATGVVTGEAGAAGEDTWVRFHLLVAGDSVKDARFQAFACPHTMSTATWLCGQLIGRKRDALIPGTPAEWAERCAVPIEKLGRLCVLEDALRACLSRWS